VWVGSMASPYNADAVDYFLRDILPRIRRGNPKVQVTFVGGEPTRLLREQAVKNKNIKIAGYVDDVRPYMREAAVFIAPMRSGSGTNIKILNALSMGMPVVTTPIGAEGLEVKDGKNIMVAQTAEEFAKRTLLLLDEPILARRLGMAGRRVVTERYDWQHLHRETERLYTQLVEVKRAARARTRGGNDIKEEEEAVIC
ncbi:glycosyltransferase, partial [Candidatus Parcubacteria bacterium]